jgi:hypothetical protein
MIVKIINHYQDSTDNVSGNEDDVRKHLFLLYPYLLQKYGPHCTVEILVKDLNNSQFCTAGILLNKNESISDGIGLHLVQYDSKLKYGQINNKDVELSAYREAAEFLSGTSCTDTELHQALLETEDPATAALLAHNLPPQMLGDLEAVVRNVLSKSESSPVTFKTVEFTNESSKDFADIIQKAVQHNTIGPVQLGTGKHTVGTLRAVDPDTQESYLLKPGSGKQNPILGENETGATQSQREAAFYALACSLGLQDDLPECHLLLLDGKEYACMRLLSYAYKNMGDLKRKDPNLPVRLFHLYNNGTLHKWATLDYVGGNPDRHSGNIMASGDSVKLIDHGSTFAGISFSPATDGISFVPFYLRTGTEKFNKLPIDEKLRKLPRLNNENELVFKKWLTSLKGDLLGSIIQSYGIDPLGVQMRLARLQKATTYQTADLAVLSAWVIA